MVDRSSIIERGLIAALELAEHTSWQGLTLSQIAVKADIPLSDFQGVASKDTLVDAVEGHFDRAMSAEGVTDDGTPRERLFEAIMLRFEAMEPYRAGLLSLMKSRETSPARLAHLVAARRNSAEWALVSSGLDDDPAVTKTMKTLAIGYAIAMTERAWRKEDSPDFTKTMSVLDRELGRIEEKIHQWKSFTARARGETRSDKSDSGPSAETES